MSWLAAPLNEPLTGEHDEGYGYRLSAMSRRATAPPTLRVMLAFSGGGTRAAALAYGVLEELRAQNGAHGLLDAVDIISSVSGGSFTAAYYGLFGDAIFSRFGDEFLNRRVRDRLLGALAMPWNWARLASPWFDRVDLAAEVYERIFARKTFKDLPRKSPFIVLNATNMSLGARFPFVQEQLDLLGSDLSSYSIARAVAASAAFPFAFCPLTLANHGARPGYPWPRIQQALGDVDHDLARYQLNAAQWAYHDVAARCFCHLLDGGLADNSGARQLVEVLLDDWLAPLTDGSIERIVVIVVDAKCMARSARSDGRRRAPGLLEVGLATGTVALDNYTDDSTIAVEQALGAIQSERISAWQGATGKPWPDADPADEAIRYPILRGGKPTGRTAAAYVAHVTFAAIADEAARERAMQLPTDLQLPAATVEAIVGLGRSLLRQAPAFARLLQDLAAPAAEAPSVASGGA